MKYRRPDENKGVHKMNVESAYLEFGGETDPSKIGWNKNLYWWKNCRSSFDL